MPDHAPRPCRQCGRPFLPNRKSQKFCSRVCQQAARFTPPAALRSNIHVVIPDTQVKAGVPNNHLGWISQYIYDRYFSQPVTVVHLGDHWDMPSLSSYDKGKGSMEGRRYRSDIDAGNRGMEILSTNLITDAGLPAWAGLDLHLLRGNHEERIVRAVESDIQLEGLMTLDDLESPGWQVHDFLVPATIDGVVYAHYFYNPMTGRPYGGENPQLRLKTLGHSFTMGHQQTLQYGLRFVNGRSQHALIAGACYQHDEDYKGPQGNAHWRGIVVCNNVEDGSYDPMFVSLDYLCRRYEGARLSDHEGVEL